MKSIRVKLMRQMKEESERFRALKAQKDKEINHLKDQVSAIYYTNKSTHKSNGHLNKLFF